MEKKEKTGTNDRQKSKWVYRKGKICCEKCLFHPDYSLYARDGYSNSNFCPNCGAEMK